jgi:hypothetical protein
MEMTKVDRSEVARALAKAIAYRDCGSDDKADAWACELVRLLGAHGILNERSASRRAA